MTGEEWKGKRDEGKGTEMGIIIMLSERKNTKGISEGEKDSYEKRKRWRR